MNWFWSPSKGGFFNDEDNVPSCGNPVPADAVEISDDARIALLEGQCAGRQIITGADGIPSLQP